MPSLVATMLKTTLVFGLLLICGCHGTNRPQNNRLLNSIRQKDVEAVRQFLAAGVDLEPTSGPYDVIKPLSYAAAYGNLEIVKLLVQAGADLNGRVAYGDVPLIKAAENRNDDVTEYLIQQGADVNAANEFGVTPFIGLCGEGNLKLAELAAKQGGDLNASFITKTGEGKGTKSYSPLQAAAADGQLEVAKLLLSLGANPEAKDGYKGQTALEVANSEGHTDVAELLRKSVESGKKD